MSNLFTRVNYRQFRITLNMVCSGRVNERGNDTFICDHSGDVQAVVCAAFIDGDGDCHPAEYFVKTASPGPNFSIAA